MLDSANVFTEVAHTLCSTDNTRTAIDTFFSSASSTSLSGIPSATTGI